MRSAWVTWSVLAVAWAGPAAAASIAFPGAVGYGKDSVGGRAGAVYEVTTLADSGAGSLRACVEASGARTCVFRVGGTIELDRAIFARNPYLTIAGQTAPGGGVALRLAATPSQPGTPLILQRTHDVIIRHLRLRPGPSANRAGTDALTLQDVDDVIIDHVSMSWAPDENFNIDREGRRVTVEWSILAEGLMPHSKGSLTCSTTSDCEGITFYRNLYISNRDRNPDVQSTPTGCVDFAQNVVHDPKSEFVELWSLHGGTWANIVDNVFQRGPDTWSQSVAIGYHDLNAVGVPRIYQRGNLSDVTMLSPDAAAHIVAVPTCRLSVESQSAARILPMVLARVGAWPRDAVDRRLAGEVSAHQGQLVSDPREVGGWPVLAAGTAAADSDHDGMPDVWERAHGGNPNDPRDGAIDADGDGLTALEDYLAARAASLLPPG